ncbi:hypothetical protein [uncultured Pseudomonas sp.]|uniref:hypothetical protein n=1 Tax=uncultured Pseudomonas sp. TaxID=114707 RepID=UPI0025DA3C12|nr:hypothetical protein [uncultured Pseudomonas sp.]
MTATTYRIHPQPSFNFGGLVIDNFAGGGGASTGIEMALGRPVDIAINHDPEAIAMHEINHPHTKHFCESVWRSTRARSLAGDPSTSPGSARTANTSARPRAASR